MTTKLKYTVLICGVFLISCSNKEAQQYAIELSQNLLGIIRRNWTQRSPMK